MQKSQTETLLDENGFEITVGYTIEKGNRQIEEGHGFHEVHPDISIELTAVEIIIAGTGIDILPKLYNAQKSAIISRLTVAA